MTDIYNIPYEINTIVDYDFYKDYLGHNHFKEKFKQRLEYIKNKYENNKITEDDLIKKYFVEIFSWSVIPREILFNIQNILKENNISVIIDPCCGNAFHTFLFDTFCGFNTLSNDNQPEYLGWSSTTNLDGIKFLDDLNEDEHYNGALILSWIEGEELAFNLLEAFIGNIVISIGNYQNNTRYSDDLNYFYELKLRFKMYMPWKHYENIEIHIRKIN
jgi:hypothetical protein